MVSDTQQEAYAAIRTKLPFSRAVVLEVIRVAGGATLFECVERLGQPSNCVSGRITELAKVGLLRDSGDRRPNPNTGRRAIVWVPA